MHTDPRKQYRHLITGTVIEGNLFYINYMMKKIILCLLIFSQAGCAAGQDKLIPETQSIRHNLGDTHIIIEIAQYGTVKNIVFINLHADEKTSVEGARRILESKGGTLIRLVNNDQRNIKFALRDQVYTFDPNRIFSRTGIEKTLSRFKNKTGEAVEEVVIFANRIISLIPPEASCVVALHNNTDGNLSIKSYMPGSEYAQDAKEVFENKNHDPDDFFLTTDSLLFTKLSSEEYNVVLQDNQQVQQDGSLSVYFGEKNRCYLNCETEHGKTELYEQMLMTALDYTVDKN